MAGAGCICIQCVQQSLSATLRDICVVFEKALIVWLIRKVATYQRQFVFYGKCLPRGVIDHRPAIPIRTGHEYDHGAERSRIVRIPEPEFGLGVIAARRPLPHRAWRRGPRDKRKKQVQTRRSPSKLLSSGHYNGRQEAPVRYAPIWRYLCAPLFSSTGNFGLASKFPVILFAKFVRAAET